MKAARDPPGHPRPRPDRTAGRAHSTKRLPHAPPCVPCAEHLQQQCAQRAHSAYGFRGSGPCARDVASERTGCITRPRRNAHHSPAGALLPASLCLAATSASLRAPPGPSATTERVIDRRTDRSIDACRGHALGLLARPLHRSRARTDRTVRVTITFLPRCCLPAVPRVDRWPAASSVVQFDHQRECRIPPL